MPNGNYITRNFEDVLEGFLERPKSIFPNLSPNLDDSDYRKPLLDKMLRYNNEVGKGEYPGFVSLAGPTIRRWVEHGVSNRMEETCHWFVQFSLVQIGGLQSLVNYPKLGAILDQFRVSLCDIADIDASLTRVERSRDSLSLGNGLIKLREDSSLDMAGVPMPREIGGFFDLSLQLGFRNRDSKFSREPIKIYPARKAVWITKTGEIRVGTVDLGQERMYLNFQGQTIHGSCPIRLSVEVVNINKAPVYEAHIMGHHGYRGGFKAGSGAMLRVSSSSKRYEKLARVFNEYDNSSTIPEENRDGLFNEYDGRGPDLGLLKSMNLDEHQEPDGSFFWWFPDERSVGN